jgi:CRP-like cAMP-binding protein
MLSTMAKVRILRQMDLFGEVAAEELAQGAYVAHEMAFAPGTRFIALGDPGDAVYIIVDGEVEIVVPRSGTVARRAAPTILGEMALFTGKPRAADCIAATPLTVLRISQEDFRTLLTAKPGLAYGIIRVLAARLDERNTAAPPAPVPAPTDRRETAEA